MQGAEIHLYKRQRIDVVSTAVDAGRSNFIDLAFLVPRLLQTLCPEHAAALAATSRQLRQLTQQVPMAIRLASAEDLKLLQKGGWIQINSLHLSNHDIPIGQRMPGVMAALGAAHWPALSSLQLDFMIDQEVTLLIKVSMPLLSKLQLLDSDAPSLLTDLIRHGLPHTPWLWPDFCCIVDVFRGYWPRLISLVVGADSWTINKSSVNLAVGADFVLIDPSPIPECLQLGSRSVCIDLPRFVDFIQLYWSNLCNLSLDCTEHESAVQLLTSADLSSLLALTLQTCKYYKADFLYLSRGNWPLLQQLCLAHCKLTVQSMKAVTTGKWPCLKSLDLCNTDLNTGIVAELAKGQWPMLTTMNLEANWDLEDDAIAELVCGNWPLLKVLLCSVSPRLTEVGLQLLVTANWLHMTELSIAWAGFAVSHGQCRQWDRSSSSLMAALRACANVFSRRPRPVPLAVQVLSMAEWPSLTVLDISMNGFEPCDVAPLLTVWPNLQIEL